MANSTNHGFTKGVNAGVLGAAFDANMDQLDKIVGGVTALSATTGNITPSLSTAHKVSLTQNLTPTVAAGKTGQEITVIIVQNASAAKTWTWPANVKGGMTISVTLSSTNVQSFIYDGTNWLAMAAGITF